ncbi:MAG: M23 family metallopeptidase [Proteobacteria bacterium]|nr:M23 family metallopeptidase [Pseudomonadota bacterium]
MTSRWKLRWPALLVALTCWGASVTVALGRPSPACARAWSRTRAASTCAAGGRSRGDSGRTGLATLRTLYLATAVGLGGAGWSSVGLVDPTWRGVVTPLVVSSRIASPLAGSCDPLVSSGYSSVRSKKAKDALLPRLRLHGAVDLPAARGTPIVAGAFEGPHWWWPLGGGEPISQGRVVSAGWLEGYDKTVVIRYTPASGPPIDVRYAHLESLARGIKPGAQLPHGRFIGKIGPEKHVHVELHVPGSNGQATRYRPRFAPCAWPPSPAKRGN